ncbi:MAG: hypothetical protein HFI87_05960 [Bacilli bacterium]|nr:hypothetical protein [Bacilli bacterium]
MWKGYYGIFSNFSCSNFTFRPKFKKQRLKEKTLGNFVEAFFSTKTNRDNA